MKEYRRRVYVPSHQWEAGTDTPIESIGACKNSGKRVRREGKMVTKCLSFNTTLGNGFCIVCWDYEVDRRSNSLEQRMLGASNAGFKNLPN